MCFGRKKRSWRLLLRTGVSTTATKPSPQTYLFEKEILCVFACICYNADTGPGLFYDEFLFVATLTVCQLQAA